MFYISVRIQWDFDSKLKRTNFNVFVPPWPFCLPGSQVDLTDNGNRDQIYWRIIHPQHPPLHKSLSGAAERRTGSDDKKSRKITFRPQNVLASMWGLVRCGRAPMIRFRTEYIGSERRFSAHLYKLGEALLAMWACSTVDINLCSRISRHRNKTGIWK